MEARYRRRLTLGRLQRPSPEKTIGYAELNDDSAITINETETDDNHSQPTSNQNQNQRQKQYGTFHNHHGDTSNYHFISGDSSASGTSNNSGDSKVGEKENSGPTPPASASSSPLRGMFRMTLGQRSSFRQVDRDNANTTPRARGRDATPRKSSTPTSTASNSSPLSTTNQHHTPTNKMDRPSSPLLSATQSSYSEHTQGGTSGDAFHNISDVFKAALDAELTKADFQDPFQRALERKEQEERRQARKKSRSRSRSGSRPRFNSAERSRSRQNSRSRSRSGSRPRFNSAEDAYELPPIHRMREDSPSSKVSRRSPSPSPTTSSLSRQRRLSNPNLHVKVLPHQPLPPQTTPLNQQQQPYDERESRRRAERERILRLMNGLDALLIDTPKNANAGGNHNQRPPKPTTTPTATPNATPNGTPNGNATVTSTATTTAQVKAASVQERAKIKNLMYGLDQLLVDTPPGARGKMVSQFHEHPQDQQRSRPPLSTSGIAKERIGYRYQHHSNSHSHSNHHQLSSVESRESTSDTRTVNTSSTDGTTSRSSSSGTHTTSEDEESVSARPLPTSIRTKATDVSGITSRGTSFLSSNVSEDKSFSSVSTAVAENHTDTNNQVVRTASTMDDLNMPISHSSSIISKPSDQTGAMEMRLNQLTPRSQVQLLLQRSHSGSLDGLSARDPSRSPGAALHKSPSATQGGKQAEVPQKMSLPKRSYSMDQVLKEQQANQIEAKLRHHTQLIPMDPSVPMRDIVANHDRLGFSTSKTSTVSALTMTTTTESSAHQSSQNNNHKEDDRKSVEIPECHEVVSEITTMSTQKSCDDSHTAASWHFHQESNNNNDESKNIGFKSPGSNDPNNHNTSKADNEKFMKSPPALKNEGTQVTMKTSYDSRSPVMEEDMEQQDDFAGSSPPQDTAHAEQKYQALKWNPSDEHQAQAPSDESLHMPVLLEAMQRYRQRIQGNLAKGEDGGDNENDHPSNNVDEDPNQDQEKSSHGAETDDPQEAHENKTLCQDDAVADSSGSAAAQAPPQTNQRHQVQVQRMDAKGTLNPPSSESKSHERRKSGGSALDHALLAVAAKPPVPVTPTRRTVEPGSLSSYPSVRDRIKAFSETASAASSPQPSPSYASRGRSPSPSYRGRSPSPSYSAERKNTTQPTDKPEQNASTGTSAQGGATNEAELQSQQNNDPMNGNQGTAWAGNSTGLPPLAGSSNEAQNHRHTRQISTPTKSPDSINGDKGAVEMSTISAPGSFAGAGSASSNVPPVNSMAVSRNDSQANSVVQRHPPGQSDHESVDYQVPGPPAAMENNHETSQGHHSGQESMSGQVTIHPYNAHYGPPPSSYGIQSQQSANSQSHMEGGHLQSTESAPQTPVFHQQQSYASHQPFNSPGQQSHGSYMMPPTHPNQHSNGNMHHPQPSYYHPGGNSYQPQSPGMPPPRGYYRPGSQQRQAPLTQTSSYQAHHGAVVNPSESTGSCQPRQQNFPQHRLEVRTASPSPPIARKVLARSIESQEAQFHHGTNEIVDKSLASTPLAKTKHSRYHRGGKFLDEPVQSRGSNSYIPAEQERDPSPSRRREPRGETPTRQPTPNERTPKEGSRRTPKRNEKEWRTPEETPRRQRSRSKRSKTPTHDDDNTIAATTVTNGSDRSPTYSSGGSSFEDEDDDERTTVGPTFSQNVMGMFDGFQLPSFTNCIASTKGVVDNMVLKVERTCIKPPEMPNTSKREKRKSGEGRKSKRERKRKSSSTELASTIRRASSQRSHKKRSEEPDGMHIV